MTDDKDKGKGTIKGLPVLPRAPGALAEPDDPTPAALGPPEQLGFDLRFEAGRTLLALNNRNLDKNGEPGVVVAKALFEVPDVDYPLNVSGGPQQFKNRRLSLRAIELTLSHASLYVVDKLRAAGFTLHRERSRTGGIELLVEMAGPSGPIPIRARGLFAPVGEAGVAVVLHEVIAFASLPRPRSEIAQQLLDALHLPGAQPARAMIRRADPFRAVLARLLPSYGWKVPAVGDVRVHEVVLGKGEITLRAWARELPEGWKAPRDQKRGPLEEAVALAVFADGLVEAADDAKRIALVDKLTDEGALAPSVVPFAAEILRRDPRRRAEGIDLLKAALEKHDEHLGLLAAMAEEEGLDGAERARRLAALGKSADGADEPWVAARAFLVAAESAGNVGDKKLALECAEAAFLADPSVSETGSLTARLLAEAGEAARALSIGRTALERAEDPVAADAFAVWLAALARKVEGLDSARVLLRRALRKADRRDALVALIDVEVEAGALERAAELLTRLLVLIDKDAAASSLGGAGDREARADVELLAARIAEARGDRDAARTHLAKAKEIRPTDAVVAVRLATLLDDDRQLDRALEALREAVDVENAPAAPLVLAARLLVKRRSIGDADRARNFIARVPAHERTPAVARVDAEALALMGQPAALAELLVAEADASPTAAESSRKLLEAARLFVDAKRVDDAAGALARAFANDSTGVAELLVNTLDVELVKALGTRADTLQPQALHAAAGRLAGAGRPRDAHALLGARTDKATVELRATFAESAGDTALEIAERERLLTLLEDAPANAAQVYRRLGTLHMKPGGRGAGASADAWAHAAMLQRGGAVDVAAWLEAALASNDGAKLAAVLRRDDADVPNVPSGPLRNAIATLTAEGDAPARLKLAGLLASRGERLEDVETYLAEARALPPQKAAQVLAEAGQRHGRGAWLLDAADILEQHGNAAGGLALLLDATGPVREELPVAERALQLAITLQDAQAIERAAAAILARTDLEKAARLDVHARRAKAMSALDGARGRTALGSWLDEDPAASEALQLLVPDLLKRGELASAVDRLDKAARQSARTTSAEPGPPAPGMAPALWPAAPLGAPAELFALLERASETAQKKGDVGAEIRARELLLGTGAFDEARKVDELERLADLYGEAGRTRNAVDALRGRVALGGSDEKLAALWARIAQLEENQLKDKGAAAEALRGRLRHAPDDASASKHLQQLLAETADDAGILEECLRRAARLKAGAERTEHWLKAGDAALKLNRPRDARDIWLRALKSTPFSKDALERLLQLGRTTKNHHLIVRARVAAAQTLADGAPAADQAAEAGAYLYGFMGRTRLALAAFRFAESRDKKPARHTRIIVDLHRALNEGSAALAALDQLLERAKDRDKVVLLETRAEILEELLGEKAEAANARRKLLELDPTQRTAARSLSRSLRDQGDLRGALEVDRNWADAALVGDLRASAYAVLSARAEEELDDAELAAELCAASLRLAPSVDVMRRQVRALIKSKQEPAAADALAALLHQSLPVDERLMLVRQKATLESQALGQKKAAKKTLATALADAELAGHADADALVDDLARIEEELEEPEAAATLLLSALEASPSGTKALGDRVQVLERAARLLDDAKDKGKALGLLEEAALLGELQRSSELRRARLAEELGQHATAEKALQKLLARAAPGSEGAEERVALLGRLALSAERQGDLETALSSWKERAERMPGDAESLRAAERLARQLERPADARAAADALLLIGDGSDDERFARLLWCARDSRDRLGDAPQAVGLLDKARVIRTDASLRRESLACAEAAGDAAAALALLDEMGVRGDTLDPPLLLRRAELRLAAGGDVAIAFEDTALAVDELGEPAADNALARQLVDQAAQHAPHLVARALLTRANEPTAAVFRNAFTGERLAEQSMPSDLLASLADALASDREIVVAAAQRERAEGKGARAADRLWALADRLVDAPAADVAVLHEQAAEAVLSGAETRGRGDSAVLGRLEKLRPSLARRADLRSQALLVLRDAEAWDAVASVLDDAVDVADSADTRRRLRLELVAVLRTGVNDEKRAAAHLQALVDEDPDDREAWGELIECLDAIGDRPQLAQALGRRAERASGIERRELIRRRAALLLDLGQGAEALAQLVAVRTELAGGADEDLKALERRVHEERGPAELAKFLAAELHRPDVSDAGRAADAQALLALPPGVADGGARVRAHLVLADDSADAARSRARPLLTAPSSRGDRVSEAVAVAERLPDKLRAPFLEGLAAEAHALGSAGALQLSDALFVRAVEGTAAAFGAAPARRRWRIQGPRRVSVDVERLMSTAPADAAGDDTRRTAAAIMLRRATRLNDRAALSAAIADVGATALAWQLAGEDGAARSEIEERAWASLAKAAQSPSGVVAAVRAGDTGRGQAFLAALPDYDRGRAAARARQIKLTPARLTLRLALAHDLPNDAAIMDLERAVQVAMAGERWADAAGALDAILTRSGGDVGGTPFLAPLLSDRADVAWRLSAPDAAEWSTRAADALPVGLEQLRHRKKAVEGLLRSSTSQLTEVGLDASPLGRALLAFARAAPDDAGVQSEALGIAQASGLHDVVDTLMAESADRSASAADRAEAVRKRAEHRLVAQKDAQGAFSILLGGAAGGDRSLREAAYALAAGEGLVEAQLEVVDDDLAKAGLLALLGKSEQASALARSLDSAAGWLLAAELAVIEGDTQAEAQALEKLGASGAADPGTLTLLVGLDRRRGRLEEAAVRAAELVEKHGASPDHVALLLEVAGGGAGAKRTAPVLRAIVDVAPESMRRRALDVWEAAATIADLADDVRAARLKRCRLQDEDDLWVNFLAVELPKVSADEAALWLRPLLSRRPLLRRLLELDPTGLAGALGLLVRTGDAPSVSDALSSTGGAAPGLSARLTAELAAALAVLGRPADAARALLAGPVERGGGGRRAASAARFFLEAGDVRGAVDALLEAPLSEFDDELVRLAREVARGAGGEGAPLLVRIAVANADSGDVDKALELAEQSAPDVALAIAGWHLKNQPLDDRGWRIVANRGAGAAQQHFSVALALRGQARWPSDLVDDGARARRLREGTIPAHLGRAWAEARRPRTPLQRARLGRDKTAREQAWRELATLTASAGARDEIAAARLLARAGVPMSQAPIEVRLAVDPELSTPGPRIAAIAAAAGSDEIARDARRRAALTAAFDDLDAKGWAGAQLRQDVHGARPPTSKWGLVGQIDAEDLGAGADAVAVMRVLGRRPSASKRATAAALLAASGKHELARFVDPRILGGSRTQPDAPALEARAREAAAAKQPAQAVGLLRLVSALSGYDAERERTIQDLAEKANRVDLLVESLGRMAGAARGVKEQAGVLRERATILAGQVESGKMLDAAVADARFAFDLVPDDDGARLWLQLAELRVEAHDLAAPTHTGKPPGNGAARPVPGSALFRALRELADALGAVAVATEKPSERSELAARRVRILAERLGDTAAALEAVQQSLEVLPGDAALLEERARTLQQLGRHFEAGGAFNDAAAARSTPAERKQLRRQAAFAFLAAEKPDDAVATLVQSVAEGDNEALEVAEPIAREKAGARSLNAVLELLLATVQDTKRRRVLSVERARLLADHLGDRNAAIALLENQAVADDADLGSRLALAEWYLADRRVLDAALAYESAAKIPGLPALSAGPPAREAACLLASLGDLERAGPLAESAVSAGVVDHKVLAVSAAWHRAHGRHAEVDALIGKEIELESDPRLQATMWMERAEVRREKLKDTPGARKAIHRVLELVPDHPGALDAMRGDAEREGTWGPLRAALFRAADFTADKAVRIARLQEIALLDADRFNDLKAAEATIDRALEIDGDAAQSLVLKARFMVRGGQIDGVPALIERAERSGAQELPGLLHLVRGDGLLISGDRDGARDAFTKAARDPETATKAWDRLIDLTEGTPGFIGALEEARRAAEEPKRKAQLLKKEARARAKAGDDDGQLTCLEALLALEPGDTEALKVVRDAYTRKRKLQPLLPLLSAWARSVDASQGATQTKERARRLGELGAFILDELGNEPLARDTFEEALDVDADEGQALVRLADIAWAARDDERALQLLDRIQPAQWPRDPVELVYRRARCAYSLGRDDAQERLRAVLRLDVKHQDALDMLVKLALQRKDDGLAEFALESLASAIPPREDPVRLAEACVELSALRGRQGRWQEALVAVERAFELDPANARVLESLAVAREEVGKHMEAAEAWRRIASTKAGVQRTKALERRAQSLFRANRQAEAVDLLLDLKRETGEMRYREEAEAWARQSGDATLMRRLGVGAPAAPSGEASAAQAAEVTKTETLAATDSNKAIQRGFNALHLQVRANLEENDPETALRIVEDAVNAGGADAELIKLGIDAAEKANAPARIVDIVEARLKTATDAEEVKSLARAAGRLAKERLADLDRAAGLLYMAHQADAEDVDVRFELTSIYAQIPRLSSHAVTGILQLLRRTPADPRVFALAAELAESQQQQERARSMRAVEMILRGRGPVLEQKNTLLDERPQVRPLDHESIAQRLAPTGWGGPLQLLISVLGAAVETLFDEPAPPADAAALHEKSPRGALALDRLERTLPGRPFRVLVGNVEKLTVYPGSVPTVVLPADVTSLGDAALLAAVARAYGVVRLGAVLPETLKGGEEQALLDVLQGAFANGRRDARANRLLARLRDDELRAATELAGRLFAPGAPAVDVAGTLAILTRAADRFALTVSGSVVATMHAGPLPTILREPPQRAASLLQGNTRALELAAFAARDNAWLVRRQHGLTSTQG